MPDVPPGRRIGISAEKVHRFLGWWKSPRSYAIGAVVISLLALTGAAVAVVHTGAQALFVRGGSENARLNICAAYAAVNKAVFVPNPDLGVDDPVSQTAVAANVRLALIGGGAYLRARLADEPATPANLAKAIHSMANTLEQMGLGYIAREDSAVIEALRVDLGAEIHEVNSLCQ
ncbi:MAG TPA: hypothetical protein VFR17_06145 [Mycobacterium sp.]|nr:hypothetical protein [Mycobacterium sp.]